MEPPAAYLVKEILDALPSPALAIDSSQRIVAVNAEAELLIGHGALDRNFVTILRQPALVSVIETALHNGISGVSRYISSEGTEDTTYEVTVRVTSISKMIILNFVDVSQLEQAGQMRSDFVANVSHELRTPLTALMGFIETLRGPARDDATVRERFLGIMEGEAGRMNRLVGDLLSLSRVESEQRVRPCDKVNLTSLVQSVVQTLSSLAEESSVTLQTEFPETDVTLAGDADQLKQVFTNLIENALKYGVSGQRVIVRMETKERDLSLRAAAVLVHVIDYGPGIDAVHLPRLTERFYRADSHRSRALGGTGLGLAIVKHIVNRHRGRLRIESELGKGADFCVALPLETTSN